MGSLFVATGQLVNCWEPLAASLSAFLDVGLFSTRLFCTFEVRILLGKSPWVEGVTGSPNLKMADLCVCVCDSLGRSGIEKSTCDVFDNVSHAKWSFPYWMFSDAKLRCARCTTTSSSTSIDKSFSTTFGAHSHMSTFARRMITSQCIYVTFVDFMSFGRSSPVILPFANPLLHQVCHQDTWHFRLLHRFLHPTLTSHLQLWFGPVARVLDRRKLLGVQKNAPGFSRIIWMIHLMIHWE